MASTLLPAILVTSSKGFTLAKPSSPLSMAERIECAALVLSCLKEKCDSELEALEVIVKLVCLIFPEFIDEFRKTATLALKVEVVPKGDYMIAHCNPKEGQDTAKGRVPVVRDPQDSALTEARMESVVSAIGVLLFTLGRPFNPNNPSQYTVSRPLAYISKYKLVPPQDMFMPEKICGPVIPFLVQLSESYVLYPEIRATLTRLFVGQLMLSYVTPEMNCCLTTFKLLPGSQMAHVQAIIECLQAHPWIVKMSSLRPSLQVFSGELRKMDALPEVLRPFTRLLSSDHNVLFNRNSMRPLVAVAIEWKTDLDPSFTDYQGKEAGYDTVVAEFRARAQTVGGTDIKDDTLPALLGVPEASLPVRSGKAQVSPGLV